MAAYSPSLIANAFLYKGRQDGVELSHMQLQKLVFFVYAWSLALQGNSAVADRPQAWTYGPVFEGLYHELKGYGSDAVSAYLLQMDPQSGQLRPQIPVQADAEFWGLLDQVWDRYGALTALQLSALTHEPGGPWESARQSEELYLSDNEVQVYYREKLHHAN